MSSKITHAGHIEPAYHTPNQQRMFFALASELGHNPDNVKERAKEKFKVKCFNALTKENLIYLIDRLQKQKENRAAVREAAEEEDYQKHQKSVVPKNRTTEERQEDAEKANKEMLKKI